MASVCTNPSNPRMLTSDSVVGSDNAGVGKATCKTVVNTGTGEPRDYSREPFVPVHLRDDKRYPVGTSSEGRLVITELLRSEFPSGVVHSHANMLLNKGLIADFSCFYTGLACWVRDYSQDIQTFETHFALSRDHAVPLRTSSHLAGPTSHIVMSAQCANILLGHMPLALKLWVRRAIRGSGFSKTERPLATYVRLREEIRLLRDRFKDAAGLYLFQPWTYSADSTGAVRAQLFYNKLLTEDETFLRIKSLRQAHSWLHAYDPSWIDGFIVPSFG